MHTITNLAYEDNLSGTIGFISRRGPRQRVKKTTFAVSPVNDLDLQAFVDGELTTAETRAIEHALQKDSELSDRHRTLMQQKRLLQAWWQQFS